MRKQYWNLSEFEDEKGGKMKVSHTTKENSTIDREQKIWRGWMWVTEVTEKPSKILWVEAGASGIIIKDKIDSESDVY